MTVEAYAEKHGLSIETVRRRIRSGKLDATRKGRSYVIDDTDDNTNHNTHATNDSIGDIATDAATRRLAEARDARIAQLEGLLAESKQHAERLGVELSESRTRSDSIIMQLSKTVDSQQSKLRGQTLLIEDLRQPRPLWQRLFHRGKIAPSTG